jgi:hypothetical protein
METDVAVDYGRSTGAGRRRGGRPPVTVNEIVIEEQDDGRVTIEIKKVVLRKPLWAGGEIRVN